MLINKKIIQYSKTKKKITLFLLSVATINNMHPEATQDPGLTPRKNRGIFNLNEEHGSEDMSVSASYIFATPMPVVHISKPAQTAGLLTNPQAVMIILKWNKFTIG